MYISSRNRVTFIHIGESKSHSRFSIFDSYLKMHAKIFFRHSKKLNVQLHQNYSTYRPIRLQ